MKECWINVYIDGQGFCYKSEFLAAINCASNRKLLYRIHVRMK